MPERANVEVGAELTVDAAQQVEIELRRYILRIVVSRNQHIQRLRRIDTDKQDRALP
jgi:hypothetical protein